MWADLGALQMRRADHSLNFMNKNLGRVSKGSITIIKPQENKTGNESFDGSKRRILLD